MQGSYPTWKQLDWPVPHWARRLSRRAHSATQVGHKIYIIGGLGRTRPEETRSVFILDVASRQWSFVDLPSGLDGRRNFSLFAHTSTLVDNKILFIGGFIGLGALRCSDLIFSLDLELKEFNLVKAYGVAERGALASHSADFLEPDRIIVFGGKSSRDDYAADPLFSFDPKSRIWSKLTWKGTVPCNRASHVTCLVGKKLYIFGGVTFGNMKLNDFHVLDLSGKVPVFSEIKSPLPPSRRFGSIMYYVRGQLFVFGGIAEIRDRLGNVRTTSGNDLHRFDIASQSWLECKLWMSRVRPTGRSHHAAVNLGDRVFVFGGTTTSFALILQIKLN